MPGFDRTGPRGEGPMTGRGMGYCGAGRGYNRPGFRRFGAGYGYGRGYRRAYYNAPVVSSDEERDMLKEEIEFLKSRLEELENSTKE